MVSGYAVKRTSFRELHLTQRDRATKGGTECGRGGAMRLVAVACLCFAASAQGADKTFIDYFLPMPIESSLVSDVWGAPGVFPRDPKNGLEDETMKQWAYWDGQIIKGPEGKYHILPVAGTRPRATEVGGAPWPYMQSAIKSPGRMWIRGCAGLTIKVEKGTMSRRWSFRTAVMPSWLARRDRAMCLFLIPWMDRGNISARSRSPKMSSAARDACPT